MAVYAYTYRELQINNKQSRTKLSMKRQIFPPGEVNIGITFIRWPEMQFQMNDSFAPCGCENRQLYKFAVTTLLGRCVCKSPKNQLWQAKIDEIDACFCFSG